MRASVVTLGCKVNEYESQSIMNQLKQAGYEIFEGLVPADVYVVNTCAVTNTGERKSKQVLAKLEKLNPNAKIVVCGCAVQNMKHINIIYTIKALNAAAICSDSYDRQQWQAKDYGIYQRTKQRVARFG